MDIATVLGLIIAFGALFGPIIMAGTLDLYIDVASILIVFVGAFAATLFSYTLSDMINLIAVTKNAFFTKPVDEGRIIDSMVDLGEKARREGILALEREMGRLDDPFMKKAVQLAVDGNEPEVIENVMANEIDNLVERHKLGRSMYDSLANFGPAYGMAATVIGLIAMLDSLDDPSGLGVGMALALITTFYGSVLANAIAIPMSTKLERRSKMEVNVKNMILFGVLSIHSGDNPRVTRDKLETFVAPKYRKGNN